MRASTKQDDALIIFDAAENVTAGKDVYKSEVDRRHNRR